MNLNSGGGDDHNEQYIPLLLYKEGQDFLCLLYHLKKVTGPHTFWTHNSNRRYWIRMAHLVDQTPSSSTEAAQLFAAAAAQGKPVF